MSMKIKQINDYCSAGGYASPRSVGMLNGYYPGNDQSGTDIGNVWNQTFPTVGTTRIKAITALNYQIFACANSSNNTVRIHIREREILSTSASSCAFIFSFDFNSNLKLINETPPSQIVNTSLEAITQSIPSSGMFAIVALNQSLSAAGRDILKNKGDFFIISSATAPISSYVAVGYNGQIIDSMINGGIAGIVNAASPSQLFINGKNAISTIYANGGNPTYAYVDDPNTPIDYFVLKHNDNYAATGRYIIRNHTVSVVDSNNSTVILKPYSNSYTETFYGERYYLFDAIGKDRKIDSGYISSISMFGTQAASRRFVNQEFVPFFYNDDISKSSSTASDISTIISKVVSFNKINTTNTGIVQKSDVENAIRTMTAIHYSSCSYQCESNCMVVCYLSCGVRCQGACANYCSGTCGGGNCVSTCGNSCVGTCLWSCYSNCYDGCSGACGSTCGNSCGTGSCTASCQYNCSGGCINGDSSSGSCARCWGKCSGCKHGCDGDCDGTCLNTCTGRCAGQCSGGGCAAGCSNCCVNGCYWFCYSGCSSTCYSGCAGGGCASNCSLACSTGCSILCQDNCSGSCTSSCSNTCINAATAVNYYIT